MEYFSKFSPAPASAPGSFAGALVERMAGRVLLFFARHASLLRPLSQPGKVQLAKARAASPPSLNSAGVCCQQRSAWGREGMHVWQSPGTAYPKLSGSVVWSTAQDGHHRAAAAGETALGLLHYSPTTHRLATGTACSCLLCALNPKVVSYIGSIPPPQDMAELEAAVAQNLLPLDAAGAPARVLRALRPLLFLETAELAASPLLGALPPSVVLHHLYSRAPPGLQLPHARSGYTPAQVRGAGQLVACRMLGWHQPFCVWMHRRCFELHCAACAGQAPSW